MAAESDNQNARSYRLGDYRLESEKRRLTRNGTVIRLSHKPLQVLLHLIEHRERVVARQELLDTFWDSKDVYDDSLRKSIGAIRKALDEEASGARFIETHYGEGYRYVGPLEEETIECAPATLEIEKTRGVRIVIEEEDTPSPDRPTAPAGHPEQSQTPGRKRRPAWLTVTAAVVALAFAALAIVVYRGAIARPSRPSPAAPIRSIAVLPLRNLSGDPDSDYFADGLTETFITELSKINGLKVISRSSVFTFKGKDIDPRDVGRQLGVQAMLEGSVRRFGDTVRVETRLVSADDGHIVWVGNTFDRALKDLFAVQDEISCSVAANLRVALCDDGEQQPAKHYTENVEAYDTLLKARYFYGKRTADALKKAIDYCEQAIKLDPRYAPAYAGLAGCQMMSVWFIARDPKVILKKAKAAAARALEIDDTYDEAHAVMASILAYEWDWPASRKEWDRVFEVNPAYSTYGYAYTLLRSSPDEAVRWMQHAQELDPLSVLIGTNLGQILFYARRYDEAAEQLKRVLELDPKYSMAHIYLGQTYVQQRMYDQAIEEFQKALALSEQNPDVIAHLGHAYAAAGRPGEAKRVLDRLYKFSNRVYVSPYMIAHVYAGLGEKERALGMLEQAYRERDSHIVDLAYDPTLAVLRSDPQYEELLRRVGLAQ